MGKTSYKNTQELIDDISKKIKRLNSGELGIEELENLVNSGKDLYEQLVILRYKAYDMHGEPTPEIAVEEEKEATTAAPIAAETNEVEEKEEASFDFTGFSSPEPEPEPVKEEVIEEQPSFDFTMGMEEEPKAVEKEEAPEPQEEINVPEETFEVNQASSVPPIEEEDDSLNTALRNEDEQSLRKKLQSTPVSDLKSHISIAKKFEYISSMFNGDSEAYEEAIDFLNTCATGDDARLKLNEYTINYQWDLEDKSIIKFIELVERRYI